jgi:hypothetical protein
MNRSISTALVLCFCIGQAIRAEGQVVRTINPQQAQQPAGPPLLKMRVEGGQVTAEIRNTPWQQALEELAARTGIVFEVQLQENAPVSMVLYRVSVQEAVQRIIGDNDSIFYFGNDAAGQPRIELARIFPRGAVPVQPGIRYIGTGAVTKTGDDQIDSPEQAVTVLSSSKDVDARQKAVDVLVAAKGDIAIKALVAALGDPAPEVKVAAIEGLASLNARAALPQILRAFKDSHPGVRQSAITAVALLGDAENVKDLRPMGKDPDANVAAAADLAIKKLSMRRP